MNFSQLRCFVALAETGSFTEAAYAIDMTQSAVSHALSALERELGISLLERNNKGVVALTSVGQKLLPHVRLLLAEEETIQQEARAAQGLLKGRLRLGSAHPIASPLIASMLAYFQQQYPDIDVVLFEGTLQEVREWIFTNVIDVGFLLHYPEFTKGLESQLFLMDEMRAYVANTHRLHARTSVTFDELSSERWIMRPSGCDMAEVFEHHHKGHHPHVYQASESGTVLAMVREGLGVTILPCTMLPDRIEGIKCIPLDPPIALPVGLVTRAAESASPAATLFVQTAVAWAREQERVEQAKGVVLGGRMR